MEIGSVTSLVSSANTKCVECMCLMTLLQEHISSKHSSHEESCLYFELSEWQQAGYKQIIKWTLECDRCDFKTTSKSQMFEHIANHQMLENTVQRINQSSAGPPAKRKAVQMETLPHFSKQLFEQQIDHVDPSDYTSSSTPISVTATHHTSQDDDDDGDSVTVIKDEMPEPIIIHMEEADISEITRAQAEEQQQHAQQQQQHAQQLQQHAQQQQHQQQQALKQRHQAQLKQQAQQARLKQQAQQAQLKQQAQQRPEQPLPPPLVLNHKERRTKENGQIIPQLPPSLMDQSVLDEEARKFKCQWCDFASPTESRLVYHARLEHKMFNCSSCDYVGSNPTDLEHHMTGTHDSMLCIYCGINCGNARALKKHYSMDHGTKLKKCDLCPFTTLNKTTLTHHINREHHKRKPRSCPYCVYVAYADNRLKQHILAIHDKQTPFSCPQCPMSFARKYQVQEHLKRRHGADKTPLLSVGKGMERQPEMDYKLPGSLLGVGSSTEETIVAGIPEQGH